MSHYEISSFSKREYESILNALGVKDPLEIYSKVIPKRFILHSPPRISGVKNEYLLLKQLKKVLSMNKLYDPEKIFAGVDVEPTYVPSVVKYLISRGEFLTSYTPYQPEISQGVLQALFEFQSIIAELTGMDVVNSSMYDWASSIAEALRMCIRIAKNDKVLIPHHLPNHRKSVVYTYLSGAEAEIVEYRYDEEGEIDLNMIENVCKEGCAGVYVEYPDYYGYIHPEISRLSDLIHDMGGFLVVGVDLWSLPLLKPPSQIGADIVVGEGQPMGIPMNYGGPLLGIFGVRGDYSIIRQMPGRIIGMTNTLKDGKRAFTMILQTREQHIRRDKATSNICSNEALTAIQTAIYVSYMRKDGLIRKSLDMLKLSHILHDNLIKLGLRDLYKLPFFRRFSLVSDNVSIIEVYDQLKKKNYMPGILEDGIWIINIHTLHKRESIESFVRDIGGVL